jgi:hypothetical protein
MYMANLDELVRDIFEEQGGWITRNALIFGTLADFAGAVGFLQIPIDLVKWFIGQDNDLQQVLAVIQEDFQQLTAFIADEDKLTRMRDVDLGIKDAVAAFEQLPANIAILPSLSQDFIQTQIQTCLAAALFFADNKDKWQAVWGSIPYYSDTWSGNLAPDAPADGLVDNHTYTLPQFLRSIYMLLTTIGALAPATLGEYLVPLGRCLTRLSEVHDTIVSSGIVGTRAWPPDDPEFTLYWRSRTIDWPYGAVERYSGASLVTSYFQDFDFAGQYFPLDNAGRDRFFRLVQLRIEQKKKALYSQLGLHAVRQVIDFLRSLTGQPPLVDTAFDDWTLKEALDIMGVPVPAGIQQLRAVVQSVPPFAPPPAGWLPLPAGLRTMLGQLHV